MKVDESLSYWKLTLNLPTGLWGQSTHLFCQSQRWKKSIPAATERVKRKDLTVVVVYSGTHDPKEKVHSQLLNILMLELIRPR